MEIIANIFLSMWKNDKTSFILLILLFTLVCFIKAVEIRSNYLKKKIKFLKKSPVAKAHGIIFGKKGKNVIYSPTNDEGSAGVFSATGTGKTSAVGIPTLRSWNGTSFVIDISGDINKNCPDIKEKLVYEPENSKTIPYNVFGYIDELQESDEKNEALSELIHLIKPDDSNLSGAAKFFYEGGQEILLAAFISFYHKGLDFIDICKKINDNSWKDLFTEIDDTKCAEGISHLSGFDPERASDNAGCLQEAKKSISFFATNHKVIRSVRRAEKCVVPKMIENHSIMIIIEDEKLELYSPLLNLIVSQQMQYISARPVTKESKQILLFLDEYASLRIQQEVILSALRKYRKKHCRIMICTQNLADLDILYGHDVTRAILANLKFKVLLGGLNEVESQKYFADLIGTAEKKKKSSSKSSDRTTTTISDVKDYVIEPADLDRLGKDIVILIFPSNNGYMKLKKNYYYK